MNNYTNLFLEQMIKLFSELFLEEKSFKGAIERNHNEVKRKNDSICDVDLIPNKAFPILADTNHCFVNHDTKKCLINIPKNASCTMRDVLQAYTRIRFDDVSEDYEKIIIIRNPLSRTLSGFNEVLKLRNDTPYKITQNTLFYKLYKKDRILESFKEYLNFIDDYFYEPHSFPQFWFLLNKKITLASINKIILFEDLPNILSNNKLNPNNNEKTSILKENLNCFKKQITKIYKEDFELYNNAKNLIKIN